MVNYYKPVTILELGTSFGISTAYLASGNENAAVYTIEGSAAIAYIASDTFTSLSIKNIEFNIGDFKDSLPIILKKTGTTDLAFIDGNHRKAPTLAYFQQLLPQTNTSSILIFGYTLER